MEKKSILQITELPERTEKLSREQMEQVFGAIFTGHCGHCKTHFDCALPYLCTGNKEYGYYCVDEHEFALDVC